MVYFGFVDDTFCQAVSRGWAFVFVSAVAWIVTVPVGTVLKCVCVGIGACVINFVVCVCVRIWSVCVSVCVILIGACVVSISKNAVVVSTYDVFKIFNTAVAYFHRVSVKKVVKSVCSWEVFVY